jgi:hypothetical protein
MGLLQELTLESIAKMDGGRLAIAFSAALKRAIQDCDDRPGEKKPRTVTLHLAAVPILDEDGLADNCKIQFQIHDSVPKRRSRVYDMSMRKGGHLLFNDDSPDNVDQGTFDMDEELTADE